MPDERNERILELYTAQLTTHIESMVGIFFGLFANLLFLFEVGKPTNLHTCAALVLFSVIYLLIAIGGVHFYLRLFEVHYLSEIMQKKMNIWELKRTYEKRYFEKNDRSSIDKLIKLDKDIVEAANGHYNKKFPLIGLTLYVFIVNAGYLGTLLAMSIPTYIMFFMLITEIIILIIFAKFHNLFNQDSSGKNHKSRELKKKNVTNKKTRVLISLVIVFIVGASFTGYSLKIYCDRIQPQYTSSPIPGYAEDPYSFLFFTSEEIINNNSSSILVWFDQIDPIEEKAHVRMDVEFYRPMSEVADENSTYFVLQVLQHISDVSVTVNSNTPSNYGGTITVIKYPVREQLVIS